MANTNATVSIAGLAQQVLQLLWVIVYVAGEHVYTALNAVSGAVIWSYNATGYKCTTPTVLTAVYFGANAVY